MIFEWDDVKQKSNLDKHGLDFHDADLLFDGPILEADAKPVDGERRWMATGMIYDIIATAIFTRRGNAIRLISPRRARREERARYDQLFE
jgi:uncharacterized DUF497 family protein